MAAWAKEAAAKFVAWRRPKTDKRLKRIIEVFGHSPVALPCAQRVRPWPGREAAIRRRASYCDSTGMTRLAGTHVASQRPSDDDPSTSVLVMPIALCAS